MKITKSVLATELCGLVAYLDYSCTLANDLNAIRVKTVPIEMLNTVNFSTSGIQKVH